MNRSSRVLLLLFLYVGDFMYRGHSSADAYSGKAFLVTCHQEKKGLKETAEIVLDLKRYSSIDRNSSN